MRVKRKNGLIIGLKIDLDWYKNLGIPENKLRIREHDESELAHYAKKTSDIEFEYPWGWGELEGIANRGSYDLECSSKK